MSMNNKESAIGGGAADESASDPQGRQQTNESYTSTTTALLQGGQAATLAALREGHDRNLGLAMLLRSTPSNAATIAAANTSVSSLSSNNNEMLMYQLLLQQANSTSIKGSATTSAGASSSRNTNFLASRNQATQMYHPLMSSGAGAAAAASTSLSMSQQGGGVLPLLYQQQQQQQQQQQEVTAARYQQQLLPTPLQQQLLALQRGGFPSSPQNAESLFRANRSLQQNLAPGPFDTTLLQQPLEQLLLRVRVQNLLQQEQQQPQQTTRLQQQEQDYAGQHNNDQLLLQQAEWLNRQPLTEAYILRALQQEQQQQQQDSLLLQQSAEAFRSHELSALLADRAALLADHIGRDADGSLRQPRTTYAALPSTADSTTTTAQTTGGVFSALERGPSHPSLRELEYDDDRKLAAGPSATAESVEAAAALPKEEDSQPPIEQAKKKKKRTSLPPEIQHQQATGARDEEFEAFLRTLPDLSRLRRDYDHESFPVKLHRMLLEVEQKGLAHIVSWTDSGKAFRVYIPTLFEKEIGPEYFRHQQYASFRRQLSTYGFQRLRKGLDEGAFGHSLFRRNRPDLLHMIHRVTELSEEQKSILWPDGTGPITRKRKGK